MQDIPQVERWCVLELALPLTHAIEEQGNDSLGKVVFTKGTRVKEAAVFLDSRETCRVRFMPDEEGEWNYEWFDSGIQSVSSEQQKSSLPKEMGMLLGGRIQCTAPGPDNHGPVRVISDTHFAYADGTPYFPFGTTCLEWYKGGGFDATLDSLKSSPFNKIRFSVTPLDIPHWDELEEGIRELMHQGVEADLQLDCRAGGMEAIPFLRHVIARLGAFRNVWWSLVIRNDTTQSNNGSIKEALLRIIQEYDASEHLVSIHTSDPVSDFGSRRITHISLQYEDASQVSYYTDLHRKPLILDECGCEGNSPTLWGSLPAEEMMNRLWLAICRGGYAGHGEMFMASPSSRETWQTHGDGLCGASVSRIAFLRSMLETAPLGLRFMPQFYDAPTIGLDGVYYLQYHGIHRFPSKQLRLPTGRYAVDLLDVWHMTVTPLPEIDEEEVVVSLPSAKYQALRIRSLERGPIPTDRKYTLRASSATAVGTSLFVKLPQAPGDSHKQKDRAQAEANDNFISETERDRSVQKGGMTHG